MPLPKIAQNEIAWFRDYAGQRLGGVTCSERLRYDAEAMKSNGEPEKAIQAVLDAASRLDGYEAQHGQFVIFARVHEIVE